MVQLTPDEVAAAVLARQNRRVGIAILTATTGVLWLLAAAWTGFLWVEYPERVAAQSRGVGMPIKDAAAKHKEPEVERLSPTVTVYKGLPSGYREPTPEERQKQMTEAAYRTTLGLQWAGLQLAGIAAVSLAAMLSTIALVVAVRRATLRQVRAVLADISAQLDALNRA